MSARDDNGQRWVGQALATLRSDRSTRDPPDLGMNPKKPAQTKVGDADPAAEVPADALAPKPEPKRSAMKLPEGVAPKPAGGPRQGPGWDRSASGRPQRDAARRAGKSRKVH